MLLNLSALLNLTSATTWPEAIFAGWSQLAQHLLQRQLMMWQSDYTNFQLALVPYILHSSTFNSDIFLCRITKNLGPLSPPTTSTIYVNTLMCRWENHPTLSAFLGNNMQVEMVGLGNDEYITVWAKCYNAQTNHDQYGSLGKPRNVLYRTKYFSGFLFRHRCLRIIPDLPHNSQNFTMLFQESPRFKDWYWIFLVSNL